MNLRFMMRHLNLMNTLLRIIYVIFSCKRTWWGRERSTNECSFNDAPFESYEHFMKYNICYLRVQTYMVGELSATEHANKGAII